MPIKNLRDLFVHTLQDIYYAEKQLLQALPKMASTADSKDLAQVFESHLQETREHILRLEEVFKLAGETAKGAKCPAIDGILKEARDLMDEIEDGDTRDAAMIAAAQAAEHYEITRYGTLVAWAELLQMKDAGKILGKILKDEYAADQKLTRIAEKRLNKEAVA